eukprot:123948_1
MGRHKKKQQNKRQNKKKQNNKKKQPKKKGKKSNKKQKNKALECKRCSKTKCDACWTDEYLKHVANIRYTVAKSKAVFPVEMKLLSDKIFINSNSECFSYVLNVEITRGSLRINTPICVRRCDSNGKTLYYPYALYLGEVCSGGISRNPPSLNLETNLFQRLQRVNDKSKLCVYGYFRKYKCIPPSIQNIVMFYYSIDVIKIGNLGENVWIILDNYDPENNIRTDKIKLTVNTLLISEITRESIDALKENFRDEIIHDNETIQHIVALKKYFSIT